MIDDIDQKLKEWVTTIIDGEFDVSFDHPGIKKTGSVVSIYLFNIENAIQRSSNARNIPMQLTLSYLLTVHTEDPIAGHRYLGDLLYAAKSHTDYEVEFQPVSSLFWQAFGTPPLPHFCIRVQVSMSRETVDVPRIKIPPRVEIGSMISIKGCILDSGNQLPIPNAKVTLLNTKTMANTNTHGYFSISADESAEVYNFIIEFKGRRFEKSFPGENIRNTLMTIHLNNLEV